MSNAAKRVIQEEIRKRRAKLRRMEYEQERIETEVDELEEQLKLL